MSDAPTHYEALVDHFAAFTKGQRSELSVLYGTSSAAPSDLARKFLESPELVRELVEKEVLVEPDAHQLMEELAYDHDLLIDISWSGRPARRKLTSIGLLAPPVEAFGAHQNQVPAAIAAIVAPYLRGMPATAPTLLGQAAPEHVDRVARAWGVEGATLIETILALGEHLADPSRAQDLPAILGAPEYVGAALMVLELGGACFWQEVFGHDLDQNPEFGDNVVALMRSDDREMEREIAETLLDYGIIFRLDEPDRAPLAVVPEELWSALWSIGRMWMLEWISVSFDDTAEQAVRRATDDSVVDYQAALKWFACEGDREHLSMSKDGTRLATEAVSRLVEVGGHDEEFWTERVGLALELSALRRRRTGALVENPTFRRVVDLPHGPFVRQVLFDWCTGYVGAAPDANLVQAIGLDEVWRKEAIRFLMTRDEFVPLWMNSEGLDPLSTGCGAIRTAGDSDPELLMMEIGLTNGLVWSAKLVWLDLLSLLESQMWYPRSMLVELMQLATGFAIFTQLIHVLEQPNAGYYLPVQRASLAADQFHQTHFDAWVSDIVRDLMEPLGVARSAEDDLVWLDSSNLRVESPPGLPDSTREQLMREVFDDPTVEFRVPSQPAGRLHRIDDVPGGRSIDLDRPLQTIRDWLGDRRITRFDGRRIWAE